jgi:hypothetical protein
LNKQQADREMAELQSRVNAMELSVVASQKLEEQLTLAEDKSNNLTGKGVATKSFLVLIFWCPAEINQMQRKVESQTKDMKKMMRENSQTLIEFERALARKSGECNVRHCWYLLRLFLTDCCRRLLLQELSFQVEELELELTRLREHNANSLLGKLSSTIQHQGSSFGRLTSEPTAPEASPPSSSSSSVTTTAANMLRRFSISRTFSTETPETETGKP